MTMTMRLVQVKLIEEVGPYTEDFALVGPELEPTAVKRWLWEALAEHMQLYGDSQSDEEIAEATVKRPSYDPGGATPMTFLPPLLNNKTQSYADLINIVAHVIKHLGQPLVLLLIGDGQSVRMLNNLKRRYTVMCARQAVAPLRTDAAACTAAQPARGPPPTRTPRKDPTEVGRRISAQAPSAPEHRQEEEVPPAPALTLSGRLGPGRGRSP